MATKHILKFWDATTHQPLPRDLNHAIKQCEALEKIPEKNNERICEFVQRVEARLGSCEYFFAHQFKEFSKGKGKQKLAVLSITLPNIDKWIAYRWLVEEAIACNLITIDYNQMDYIICDVDNPKYAWLPNGVAFSPLRSDSWTLLSQQLVEDRQYPHSYTDFQRVFLTPIINLLNSYNFEQQALLGSETEGQLYFHRQTTELTQQITLEFKYIQNIWRIGLSFTIDSPAIQAINNRFGFRPETGSIPAIASSLKDLGYWNFNLKRLNNFDDFNQLYIQIHHNALFCLEYIHNLRTLNQILNSDEDNDDNIGYMRQIALDARNSWSLSCCLITARLVASPRFEQLVTELTEKVSTFKPWPRVSAKKLQSDWHTLVNALRTEYVPHPEYCLHLFLPAIIGLPIKSLDDIIHLYALSSSCDLSSPLLQEFSRRFAAELGDKATVLSYRHNDETATQPLDTWFAINGDPCSFDTQHALAFCGEFSIKIPHHNAEDYLNIAAWQAACLGLVMLYDDGIRQIGFAKNGKVYPPSEAVKWTDHSKRIKTKQNLPKDKEYDRHSQLKQIMLSCLAKNLAPLSFTQEQAPWLKYDAPVITRHLSHVSHHIAVACYGDLPRICMDLKITISSELVFNICQSANHLVKFGGGELGSNLISFHIRRWQNWQSLENEICCMADAHSLLLTLQTSALQLFDRVIDIQCLDWLLNSEEMASLRTAEECQEHEEFLHYQLIVAWLAANKDFKQIATTLKTKLKKIADDSKRRAEMTARWGKLLSHLKVL